MEDWTKWVSIQAVKIDTCIICHKKLRDHSLSELFECRRWAYRAFVKINDGLMGLYSWLDVELEARSKKITEEEKWARRYW